MAKSRHRSGKQAGTDEGQEMAQAATQVPQNGQVVVFTVVPTGSYCRAGEAYRVEHNGKNGHDYRFVSVVRGSSTYDRPWAVARSQWQVA